MGSPTTQGRVLAVDYGEARVGLAISDPLGITAQPLDTLEYHSDKHLCQELARIVEARQVTEIVVGLPLELSGAQGPAAQRVLRFVRRLQGTIEVPVTLWDERLTTSAAERALREDRMSWRRRRLVVDQVAASLLLQAVLASRRPSPDELE